MGMIGTIPARRRTLLVGDAAGLVNPLQGEGISQAMRSGRAAAEAVLVGPYAAATHYRAFLAATYAPYESVTAASQSAMLKRPRLASVLGRVLTAPVLSHALRGGWSIYWNDLLEGAAPSSARTIASLVARAGPAATSRGRTRRWFNEALSLRSSSFVTRSAFPRTTSPGSRPSRSDNAPHLQARRARRGARAGRGPSRANDRRARDHDRIRPGCPAAPLGRPVSRLPVRARRSRARCGRAHSQVEIAIAGVGSRR